MSLQPSEYIWGIARVLYVVIFGMSILLFSIEGKMFKCIDSFLFILYLTYLVSKSKSIFIHLKWYSCMFCPSYYFIFENCIWTIRSHRKNSVTSSCSTFFHLFKFWIFHNCKNKISYILPASWKTYRRDTRDFATSRWHSHYMKICKESK